MKVSCNKTAFFTAWNYSFPIHWLIGWWSYSTPCHASKHFLNIWLSFTNGITYLPRQQKFWNFIRLSTSYNKWFRSANIERSTKLAIKFLAYDDFSLTRFSIINFRHLEVFDAHFSFVRNQDESLEMIKKINLKQWKRIPLSFPKKNF